VEEESLLKAVCEHLGNIPATPVVEEGEQERTLAPPAVANGTDRIKSRFASDPRIMEIIPEFVDGLPSKVCTMMDYLENNDLDGVQKIVHQLLGACGGYGFTEVTEPARSVEQSIKAGRDIESIRTETNSLVAIVRRIEGYDESRVCISAAPSGK
jgi:HPt (histidine-containing phosphotransfer) domain-containing protein